MAKNEFIDLLSNVTTSPIGSYNTNYEGSFMCGGEYKHKEMRDSFKYDAQYYMPHIVEFEPESRYFNSIHSNINRFLNYCVDIGLFLYDINKIDSYFTKETTIYCSKCFNFRDIYGRIVVCTLYIDNEVYFLNSEVRLELEINNQKRMKFQNNNFKVETIRKVPEDILRKHGFIIDVRSYMLDYSVHTALNRYTMKTKNRTFAELPYDKLPLFLSTPFVKEYAKHILETRTKEEHEPIIMPIEPMRYFF